MHGYRRTRKFAKQMLNMLALWRSFSFIIFMGDVRRWLDGWYMSA